jgi:hypothetical protein
MFEPQHLRDCGWEGVVSEIGGWGGGVMNGGAWLNVDGRRVDVRYRDLDEVEYWCAEAQAGRFKKELLLFDVAGIPTYVLMGELATGLCCLASSRNRTTRKRLGVRRCVDGLLTQFSAWVRSVRVALSW